MYTAIISKDEVETAPARHESTGPSLSRLLAEVGRYYLFSVSPYENPKGNPNGEEIRRAKNPYRECLIPLVAVEPHSHRVSQTTRRTRLQGLRMTLQVATVV